MTDFERAGHLRGGKGALPVMGKMPEQAAAAERADRVAEIFEAHADFVWRVLRRQGVAEADAEDATQEVFLVVHHKVGDYEERGTMRAWLFTICRQIASHYLRSTERRQRKQQAFLSSGEGPVDPQSSLFRAEAAALVRRFLEELDEPHAMVFYLSEIEGMTAPEVAAALGVNLNTVYGRLRATRKQFETVLERRT